MIDCKNVQTFKSWEEIHQFVRTVVLVGISAHQVYMDFNKTVSPLL